MADSHDVDVTQRPTQTSSKNDKTPLCPKNNIFPCRFEGCDSIFYKRSHLTRHEMIHNDIVS